MKKTTLLLLLALTASSVTAQGTLEDYQRAYSLAGRFSPDKVYSANITPAWIGETDSFWYMRHTQQGDEYIVVDATRKSRKPLFDHARLAKALTLATGEQVTASALRLGRAELSSKGDTLRFVRNNQRWCYVVARHMLTSEGALPERQPGRHWMETDDEKAFQPVTSPDGRYEALIRNSNVAVREKATGVVRELSIDGCDGHYYSAYLQWSPDSKYIATCRIRPATKRYIYYVESSPADQLQPKLHKQEYTKPGDELPFRTPTIFEVETGRAVVPSTELFDRQYAVQGLQWNKDASGVTFEYNQRGHQVYRILELAAKDGTVRTIVEETSPTFVNYTRRFRHDTQDDRQIIWMSERDNHNHLYLYDKQRGEVINQITRGEWYVREVVEVDEANRMIYFAASGVEKLEDPYFIRYYRIGFDGSGMQCLTPSAGMHHAWFSHDKQFVVDVASSVTTPPVTIVRNAAGELVMELEKADISAIEAQGWSAPEVFTAKGRDGKTDIWGVIVRPTNFDPSQSYPVIEYIYAGPGSHYVPKDFASYYYNMTPLAELGFIVVQIDGMGTSFRSKAFEEICYKNLKDAGFPDRKLWIKAAAEKYPYMDASRVGIFGASAGGQESTTAVLLHPEFYKAAYSACGCHDNRMDKIWWNEQWLGYPLGEQYREGSNVENAHLLTRPLMLVVGEMDDNVDPASTMQVAAALIKANKDFELVVLPSVHHTMGEKYGEHKRFDFFVRTLLGVVPPAWSDVEQAIKTNKQ